MKNIFAPAKINLFLRICGRTSSGYHNLDSVITFANFGDQISITESDYDNLVLSGPFSKMLDNSVAGLKNNLTMKALNLFRNNGGYIKPIQINLEKNIPVSAGLGGGSTDAAATLKIINKLADKSLNCEKLLKISSHLGADVPVCMVGKTLRVTGIGNLLTNITTDRAFMTVVNPLIPLKTSAVFRNFSGPSTGSAGDLRQKKIVDLVAKGNDLLKTSKSLVTEIGQILDELESIVGCNIASMSGSGASCFGVFDDASSAEHATKIFRKKGFWAEWTSLNTPKEQEQT